MPEMCAGHRMLYLSACRNQCIRLASNLEIKNGYSGKPPEITTMEKYPYKLYQR